MTLGTNVGKAAFVSEDLTVTRHATEPVEFPELGLVVKPIDDWFCLTVTNKETPFRHTFVNEKSCLIARLTRFPFTKWPPEIRSNPKDQLKRRLEAASTKDKLSQPEKSAAKTRLAFPIESGHYQHVSVQWIRLPNQPTMGSQKLLGRIETDSVDALLTVIDLLQESRSNGEVDSFCNQIERMSEQ